MPFGSEFEGEPILSWPIDSFEQFYEILNQTGFDLANFLNRYQQRSYDNIEKLFTESRFDINLGGSTVKSKIVTTDKATGIFDFSLASKGLYRVPEYFSKDLETQMPNKFEAIGLPSGVVPPNLVKQRSVNGRNYFYYEDVGKEYACEIRQKGKTAILQGLPNAKLKFATRSKKVYLTYKKNKGKVRYVEIYSLFYYTDLDSDTQFAVRHIPIVMIAEYLESIGIMTRIYMTRFVRIDKVGILRQKSDTGATLPMAFTPTNSDYRLFVQPIIVKEFGQEFDKKLAFALTSESNQELYQTFAEWAQSKEATAVDLYGWPRFSQEKYYEGIERYRNKYQEYVKLGIFKTKEVLPEAMIFFHDMTIKETLSRFCENLSSNLKNQNLSADYDYLTDIEINEYFVWWMKLSGTIVKHKIELINSLEILKDLKLVNKELEKLIEDWKQIIVGLKKNKNRKLLNQVLTHSEKILGQNFYNIYRFDTKDYENGRLTFKNYIYKLTNELQTYALGEFFGTPQDRIQKREEFVNTILEALKEF